MSWICTDIDIADIGDSGHGFRMEETDYVCVKVADDYHVYINACPHFGTRMEWMPNYFLDSKKQHILCSRHSALFEMDTGYCVQGPCEKESLTKIECDVRDGKLWIFG